VKNNRNRILALLKTEELSRLSHHFREVSIEQGQLLEERGQRVDSVHFPQTGMISLIVEIPEDRSLEVGTVGFEGAVGITACLGSRISSVSALVQVSGTSLCISASRFRAFCGACLFVRAAIGLFSKPTSVTSGGSHVTGASQKKAPA